MLAISISVSCVFVATRRWGVRHYFVHPNVKEAGLAWRCLCRHTLFVVRPLEQSKRLRVGEESICIRDEQHIIIGIKQQFKH